MEHSVLSFLHVAEHDADSVFVSCSVLAVTVFIHRQDRTPV